MNELLDRISIDPAVCGGKPCIKGTRVWVALILDFLATGMSETELLAVAHAYQQATGHHLKRPPMDKATPENAGFKNKDG